MWCVAWSFEIAINFTATVCSDFKLVKLESLCMGGLAYEYLRCNIHYVH